MREAVVSLALTVDVANGFCTLCTALPLLIHTVGVVASIGALTNTVFCVTQFLIVMRPSTHSCCSCSACLLPVSTRYRDADVSPDTASRWKTRAVTDPDTRSAQSTEAVLYVFYPFSNVVRGPAQ
jgi:hypothetical protein